MNAELKAIESTWNAGGGIKPEHVDWLISQLKQAHADVAQWRQEALGKPASERQYELLKEENERLKAAQNQWQPIATAPKDGSEIIGYRHDCGPVVIRWISPDEFLTEKEMDGMTEEQATTSDWFYADFVHGGRMSDDGLPTHWQPLPQPPKGK